VGPLDDSNMAACLTLSLYNGKGINISEDKSFFGSGCFSLKMEKDGRIKRIAMGQGTEGGREAASERERGRRNEAVSLENHP